MPWVQRALTKSEESQIAVASQSPKSKTIDNAYGDKTGFTIESIFVSGVESYWINWRGYSE